MRGLTGPVPPVLSQGMLALLSICIDRLNLYDSAAHFAETAGEQAGEAWKDILNLMYELLGKPTVCVCVCVCVWFCVYRVSF